MLVFLVWDCAKIAYEAKLILFMVCLGAFFIMAFQPPILDNAVIEKYKGRFGQTRLMISVGRLVGGVASAPILQIYGMVGCLLCRLVMCTVIFILSCTFYVEKTRMRLALAGRPGSLAVTQSTAPGIPEAEQAIEHSRRLSLENVHRRFSAFMERISGLLTVPFLTFLAVMTVNGMAGAVFDAYVNVLLIDVFDVPQYMLGYATTAAAVGNFPAFFFADIGLELLGSRGLVLVGMAATAMRCLCIWAAVHPLLVVTTNALHGAAFGLLTVGAVAYAKESAPYGMKNTAQGLIATAMQGLGTSFGVLLGGFIYNAAGGRMLFLIKAIIVSVAAAAFAFVDTLDPELAAISRLTSPPRSPLHAETKAHAEAAACFPPMSQSELAVILDNTGEESGTDTSGEDQTVGPSTLPAASDGRVERDMLEGTRTEPLLGLDQSL
mmetsp:Transcript_13027/g.37715  ORF Transcript_13027/g.37715 Transcript_13027/m.37715 type:complete len:436 (+) Transcript_13027:371-1678(+)